MQAITRFFIERWQFTLVLFGMLFMLGLASVQAIPKSEDPIVQFAGVGVVVVLPGADAEQMERVVAIPIETALNGLEYVDTISSTSGAGLASISVQFEYGTDPEKKYDEVVRELNVLRPTLPAGITLAYNQKGGLGWNDPNGWKVYVGTDLSNLDQKLIVYQNIVEHLQQSHMKASVINVEYVHTPYYRLER